MAKKSKVADQASPEQPVLPCKNEVEALLFSAGKNMTVDTITNIVGADKKAILTALAALKEEYNGRDSALMIVDEGEFWKIHVRERFLPLVIKIIADTELPKSVLETLAIIAFKSPVLQSEVIDIRSSVAYEHIGLLMDMGFVTREKKGRSFALKVTDKFFDYFDIQGDKTLKDAFKGVPEKAIQKAEEAEKKEQLRQLQERELLQKQVIQSVPGVKTEQAVVQSVPQEPAPIPQEPQSEPQEETPQPVPEEPPEESEDETPELLERVEKEIDEITKKKDALKKEVK